MRLMGTSFRKPDFRKQFLIIPSLKITLVFPNIYFYLALKIRCSTIFFFSFKAFSTAKYIEILYRNTWYSVQKVTLPERVDPNEGFREKYPIYSVQNNALVNVSFR